MQYATVPRVLVVGSANIDYTVAVSRLPQPGETVSEGTLLVNHGGKGANQAVAARRLGAEVRLIACVGDDAAGEAIRAALAAEGIETDGIVTTSAAATGTALVVVDAEGRNQIAVAPGANRALTVDLARPRDGDFAWADVVLCQLETPIDVVRWALECARRERATTLLNPAPIGDAEQALALLGLVDYLTPNEGEAGRLSGIPITTLGDARKAAAALRKHGPRNIIVTMGPRGLVADAGDEVTHVPACAVKAIDTTAAGDAFTGALAVAIAERRALGEMLQLASAAAAAACLRRGAQASLATRAEVEALARSLGLREV